MHITERKRAKTETESLRRRKIKSGRKREARKTQMNGEIAVSKTVAYAMSTSTAEYQQKLPVSVMRSHFSLAFGPRVAPKGMRNGALAKDNKMIGKYMKIKSSFHICDSLFWSICICERHRRASAETRPKNTHDITEMISICSFSKQSGANAPGGESEGQRAREGRERTSRWKRGRKIREN